MIQNNLPYVEFITVLNFYFYKLKEIISNEDRVCENFKLIGLEGEYTSFIVQLETELDLLDHILGCFNCMENLLEFTKGVLNPYYEQFSFLISGYDNEIDPKSFIKTRINERIIQLNNLKETSICELRNLRGTLNGITKL